MANARSLAPTSNSAENEIDRQKCHKSFVVAAREAFTGKVFCSHSDFGSASQSETSTIRLLLSVQRKVTAT